MSRESTAFRPDLERLQRWMQEVVVHPGTVDEALASTAAKREIPAEKLREVIRPSERLTASERVGVYHGMYLMRMEEALETDYPLVHRHLGDEAFSEFVRAYVQDHPSTSYTLNRLGDQVPRFFADHPDRPQAAFPPRSRPPRAGPDRGLRRAGEPGAHSRRTREIRPRALGERPAPAGRGPQGAGLQTRGHPPSPCIPRRPSEPESSEARIVGCFLPP